MSKQAKEQLSALPSRVSNGLEDSRPTAGSGKNKAKELESSTNPVQETEATKASRNSSSKSDTPVKMTLYISKGIAKEFKKLAIDEELDYSQLAEQAFIEFVQNHSNYASNTP